MSVLAQAPPIELESAARFNEFRKVKTAWQYAAECGATTDIGDNL
jgi:hypothetical protein